MAARKKRSAGRPSDYTPELADEICERIANGESMRAICEDDDKPNRRTLLRWLETNEEFATKCARARVLQADALEEQMQAVADDGRNDWMERQSEAEKGQGINTGWVLNGEHVQRSKLRVSTLQWRASKLNPKKYGDKLQHSGDEDNPIKVQAEVTLPPQLTADEWLKRQTEKK